MIQRGVSMYQGVPLGALNVCDEIKADMRPPPLYALLPPALLAAELLRPALVLALHALLHGSVVLEGSRPPVLSLTAAPRHPDARGLLTWDAAVPALLAADAAGGRAILHALLANSPALAPAVVELALADGNPAAQPAAHAVVAHAVGLQPALRSRVLRRARTWTRWSSAAAMPQLRRDARDGDALDARRPQRPRTSCRPPRQRMQRTRRRPRRA